MNQSKENCWFHPRLTREEAEKLLLEDPRGMDGLFVVRESVSSPSDYVLSVLCCHQVHNYQIRRHQEDSFFSIYETVKFHGLENLIDFYKTNPLSDDGLKLKTHIIGAQPPHKTLRAGSSNLLHRATDCGHSTVVTELLQSGYSGFDAKNEDGQTATHIAASNGSDNLLRILIQHQSNVNLRDASGLTPLHYACKQNLPGTVRLLVIVGGANIQARSSDNGEVPLHVAASEGHTEVVQMLLTLNAPVNPRTRKGLTPAQLARMNGHLECVQILETYEAPKPKISRNEFYHGTLDRPEAEEKIRKSNPQSGTFLVRYSQHKSAYILSLFHEKLWNYQITSKDRYLFIDDGPLLNSLEHLVEYYSIFPDGLPTVLTFPIPPPPKPDAPPISTLKKQRQRAIKPKLSLSQTDQSSKNDISPNIFENITFQSDVHLAINDNNNHEGREGHLINPNNLKLGKLIGKGEFASVYEGQLVGANGKEVKVAIKILANEQLDSFLREVGVMTNLDHHCIVKLIGVCHGPPHQMIQELVSLGPFVPYIEAHKDDINPDLEFKIWAAQIACGMHYLEENRIVHRDLAARNILLASRYQAKISDFGLSRGLEANDYYKALQGGRWPLKWYAPESYNYGEFDHKSDVWSFGVTIWEMYSFGIHPWSDITGSDAIELIDKGERLEQPKACPDNVYTKMLECWFVNKDERPTFKKLAEFFQSESAYINIKEMIPEANIA